MLTSWKRVTAPGPWDDVPSIQDASAALPFESRPTGRFGLFIRFSFTVSSFSLLLLAVTSVVLGVFFAGGTKTWWSFCSSCGFEGLPDTTLLCFLNGGTNAGDVLMLSLSTVLLQLSLFTFLINGGIKVAILECAALLSPEVESFVV